MISSDMQFFSFMGAIFGFIGWLIVVIPIYMISSRLNRTNALLEVIASRLVLPSAVAGTVLPSAGNGRASLEELAAAARQRQNS